MSAIDNLAQLKALYAKIRPLPNGGPRVSVFRPNEFRDYWTVGDGDSYYGAFSSGTEARAILKAAGFISHRMASERIVYWHTY